MVYILHGRDVAIPRSVPSTGGLLSAAPRLPENTVRVRLGIRNLPRTLTLIRLTWIQRTLFRCAPRPLLTFRA